MTAEVRWPYPALAGAAAGAVGVGAAELLAAVFLPPASPLLVVGSWVIDLVPPWVKDATISLFGTADKLVLLICLVVLVLLLAAASGALEHRRPPLGRVAIAAVGALAVIAAGTRANAGLVTVLPSLLAAAIAYVALWLLVGRLAPPTTHGESDASRRQFLILTSTTTVLGVLAVIGGRALAAGTQVVDAVRSRLTLPTPAVSVPPIPAGAALDVPGLAPLITPNTDFYRIDTALIVPQVDAAQWSLRITGMVEHEITVTMDELLALPLEESITTLACVSNYVGGDLIGTATWLGYPVRELLARAGPRENADMVLSRSIDGFTASTPLPVLTDDRNAILAVGMNGEPLPAEHGYPVRMVVPGLYGYVSATKWVTELKLTRFDQEVAYWTPRGWSERGPIKLSSRIDVPRDAQSVDAGHVTVAGVAWSPHIGISGVQVQVDGGPWRDAELAPAISIDTWRQWRFAWNAAAGQHQLAVRAIDATGEVQTSAESFVAPDGATGHHRITVSVA